MSFTWMKDINHKELMEVKGYSDLSRINLKKLLVERDVTIENLQEQIDRKDRHIKEIEDDITDHPDYDDMIYETKMNVKETIEKEQIDLRKHYSEVVKHQAEKIQKLEKKVNSQMRIAKSVNGKLQKQIRTMKDDWYDATNKLAEQNNELRREIVSLKESLKEYGGFPRGDTLKEQNEKLKQEIKAYEKATETHKVIEDKLQEKIRKLEGEYKKVCYDCKKDISSFCRTIDSNDYCLKCAVKHEKPNEEWMPKLPNHNEDTIKQQKQLIDYYELREDYFEKFIEGWESGCHEWREFCEARAHKTGNEEHVGILFDD